MITAEAHARVGLLGNPSDLYGGYGLGFAVRELKVTVTLRDAPTIELPNELFRAAWKVLGIDGKTRPFALTADTHAIPFQAGLAGSSALVIAALRAWSEWFALGLSRMEIAKLAWRAENEVLGIRAGPLDRLVQAHEGLLAMDFREPFAPSAMERLDPALLPPMLLAWHGAPSTSSHDVHAPIFARFLAGDAMVTRVMNALAVNARAGKAALEAGDAEAFRACINCNFDLRSEIFDIAPADRALIELGRSHGAAAKFPGSGGAVLMVCRDETHRAQIEAACRAAGHSTLAPTVALPTPRVRAIFLAAGFATRLYPLTLHTAKPLLEVDGTPMMTRIAAQVAQVPNVRDGVVITNGRFHSDFLAWHAQQTKRAMPLAIINDGAMTNDARLGAVRDLALACEQGDINDHKNNHKKNHKHDTDIDAYLVLACDNLFDFDLNELITSFARTFHGQLIVREVPQPVPSATYSEVTLDARGTRVMTFREKPADPQSNLSAIAVYLLPTDLPARVHEYLASGGNPDAPGHFIAWLATRTPLDATPLRGRWIDVGNAADLARAARANEPGT